MLKRMRIAGKNIPFNGVVKGANIKMVNKKHLHVVNKNIDLIWDGFAQLESIDRWFESGYYVGLLENVDSIDQETYSGLCNRQTLDEPLFCVVKSNKLKLITQPADNGFRTYVKKSEISDENMG